MPSSPVTSVDPRQEDLQLDDRIAIDAAHLMHRGGHRGEAGSPRVEDQRFPLVPVELEDGVKPVGILDGIPMSLNFPKQPDSSLNLNGPRLDSTPSTLFQTRPEQGFGTERGQDTGKEPAPALPRRYLQRRVPGLTVVSGSELMLTACALIPVLQRQPPTTGPAPRFY